MFARAALAVLFGVAAVAGPVQAQDRLANRTIKIGVLTDFSSAYASYSGKFSLAGVEMAVEDFRAKHPNRKVEVLSADHQNKPEVGSLAVRTWIDRDNVDMVADLATSAVALAVIPLMAAKKKVSIVSSGNSSRITEEDCTPYSIHWTYNTRVVAVPGVQAMVAQGDDTFFFVTPDNASGASLENDAADAIRAAGGRIVGGIKHPFGVGDFSSFILQAQASKAKVIFVASSGPDVVNAVKSINEFGLKKTQKVFAPTAGIIALKGMGLELAQGLYYATGFYWDQNDPDTRAFSKRYADRMGQPPENTFAANYSSTLHYLNAVEAVGTTDGDAVMAQMRKTPVRDMFTKTGKLREDGKMVYDYTLYQVKTPAESKGPWDLMKPIKTVAGDIAYGPPSAKCKIVK
jgi:branched-chain amino acid transport system substrate-binding protein